eukprot:CAMPEP_0184700538 /NCGR_PEP_ID=MMETSP0313-20130426/14188_1 /TAXON_ID=2792 /ORGANISM="Porphyridium aerugineum, Strain SAG 1380-2" /LENGTH=283 /DNA_ID=CAMNT_0027160257 /DNA_START=359 /DNA_END=1210 /DNA_ORIENTATION=+
MADQLQPNDETQSQQQIQEQIQLTPVSGYYPTKGAHIMVWRGSDEEDTLGGYWHHGIDCGDNTAIHYTGIDGIKSMSQGRIGRTSLSEFQFEPKHHIHLVEYNPTESLFSPDQVVERAASKIGHARYHLLFDNCESFSRWCKTGQESSHQSVGMFVGLGVGLVVGVTTLNPLNGLFAAVVLYKMWDRSQNRSQQRLLPQGSDRQLEEESRRITREVQASRVISEIETQTMTVTSSVTTTTTMMRTYEVVDLGGQAAVEAAQAEAGDNTLENSQSTVVVEEVVE